MERYLLDITDSYERFICMSSDVGLRHYISFPEISSWGNDKFVVTLENIEVNMYEDIWFSPVVNQNPNSIIASLLKEVDISQPECIFTVVLKRARVIMDKKVSLCYCKMEGKNIFTLMIVVLMSVINTFYLLEEVQITMIPWYG